MPESSWQVGAARALGPGVAKSRVGGEMANVRSDRGIGAVGLPESLAGHFRDGRLRTLPLLLVGIVLLP